MKFDLSKRWCWYFNELSKIPRPSRHEAAAAAWVKAFAESHKLEWWQDEWGNTIIYKEASPGREHEASVMLQGHLDMVPACAPGVVHDWEKDPLSLKVEGDYLMADGTTLGADDGVAIAYMLAILEDDTLSHPPLECVFTVMEEIGLEGALHLKPENIRSRRVISLDGGSETSTMCCAAGGIKGAIHVPVNRASYSGTCMKVSFSGCLGGHSGIEIDQEHANPILLLARFLRELQEQKVPFRLVNWNGGAADNSIPQFSELQLETAETEKLETSFAKFKEEVFTEYGPTDPGMKLVLYPCKPAVIPLSEESGARLIALLNLVPNGVTQRNLTLDIPATSDNVGTMELKESEAIVLFRIRSLYESGLDDELRKIRIASELNQASVEVLIRYPGWNYHPESALRDALNPLIQKHYGKDLVIEGTHGGNETGIWSGLHPDSDIISIGSVEEKIHTPEERLDLKAFDRMYHLLTELLEVL